LWVIFALLDPDPDSEYGSGSRSTGPIEYGSRSRSGSETLVFKEASGNIIFIYSADKRQGKNLKTKCAYTEKVDIKKIFIW
jgi:hypothetical protein